MFARNVHNLFAFIGLINGFLTIIIGIGFILYDIFGKEREDIGIGIFLIIVGIGLLVYAFS